MDPQHSRAYAPATNINTHVLTILFMNLHKGFVRLLCSGKIVLVLEDKRNCLDVQKPLAMAVKKKIIKRQINVYTFGETVMQFTDFNNCLKYRNKVFYFERSRIM